jgi:predicted O-methyltransferase YrrM
MLYELKMAGQLFRKEGFMSVMSRTWHYVFKLPRYLLFSFKQMHPGRDLELHEWVNFAFTGCGGLIMPLQVRSEILQLLKIIELRAPKYILEIGTSNGGTLFLFSRVAADNACMISLDLPLGSFGGGYPAWKRPFYKSFAKKEQTIRLIRADTHDPATQEKVAAILQANKIDLLFIDGDHTYGGVKKDFEMYEPFVKDGGMVVLHDIVPHRQEHGCGVDRYWNEIKGKKEYQEFVENPDQRWAGLGLIIHRDPVKSNRNIGVK